MALLVLDQDVLDDEVDPLGDVYFEEEVVANQLVDDFVDDVVELPELPPGVGVLVEDVAGAHLPLPHLHVLVHEVLLHVEQQLEEELADA